MTPRDPIFQEKTPYGVIATFQATPDIFRAAKQVHQAGFQKWDILSPFPVHGLDKAMGMRRSRVPIFTLLGGVTGFVSGMLMTWYMNGYDYPLIIGGKPFWSPIYPFPIAYELTILLASFGTLIGMFLTNRLPQHYHPVFEYEHIHRATDDQFLLIIQTDDPLYHPEKTPDWLRQLGAHPVTILEAPVPCQS